MFSDEREVGDVLTQFFSSIEAVIKSLGNIHFSFNSQQNEGITSCLYRSLQILRTFGEISSIGSFEFKRVFAGSELLKAIFDVKVVDSSWESKAARLVTQDKVQMTIIRELLEGYWLQSKDLTRVYETLIKRQMFYQFKQTFKREENKELLDALKGSILIEQV